MPAIINDDALQLGPCNLYKRVGALASLSGTDIVIKAKKAGVLGNSITFEMINAGNDLPLEVSVVGTAISVQLETVVAAPASTLDEVIAAINASAEANALVYAVRKATKVGTEVQAVAASAPLVGGSDTTTDDFLGALGEETAITVVTEAVPLTAAQSGSLARKKVITGGKLSILAPLKEMTLERFVDAVGNAELLVGDGVGAAKRLEFKVNVGQDLRTARGFTLILKRLVGANQESADPNDTLTIPTCSPVDAEVELAYNPTTQRQINATFEAWPDGRGMLAYFGSLEL